MEKILKRFLASDLDGDLIGGIFRALHQLSKLDLVTFSEAEDLIINGVSVFV